MRAGSRSIRWSLALSAFAVACGGGGSDDDGLSPPPATPVAEVTVTPGPTLTLSVGGTTQLSATARDAQGNVLTGRTISWSSAAQGVATVSTQGLVTAVAVGTAQIRATSEGKTGEVTVTVESYPWALTGSLATGRTLHTATLLADGRVLVTGGQTLDTPQSLRSTEVYNPTTGAWTGTGNLTTARSAHVAIRLQNGKVLVAGGVSDQQSRLASTEIYDPATGTWTTTGSMVTARQQAVAMLLSDGRVLVMGGSGPGTGLDPLATSEIYNPATGQWASSGTMTVARVGHTALVLPSGKILVAGGVGGSVANPQLHASAELYEPSTGAWTGTGNFLTARAFHSAILLANGRPLILGGSNFLSTAYGAADLYDPLSGGWTATGSMLTPRLSHTATRLPNGKVLVAGGTGALGTLGNVETYDPATGTWSAAAALRVARFNHAAVLLTNGKLLVVGGQGAGASTSAELFDSGVAFSARSR